jgi:hypothetical protein
MVVNRGDAAQNVTIDLNDDEIYKFSIYDLFTGSKLYIKDKQLTFPIDIQGFATIFMT